MENNEESENVSPNQLEHPVTAVNCEQLLVLVRKLHEENTYLWRELESSSQQLGRTEQRTVSMREAVTVMATTDKAHKDCNNLLTCSDHHSVYPASVTCAGDSCHCAASRTEWSVYNRRSNENLQPMTINSSHLPLKQPPCSQPDRITKPTYPTNVNLTWSAGEGGQAVYSRRKMTSQQYAYQMEVDKDKRDSGTCDHSESERADGVIVNDAQTNTSCSPDANIELHLESSGYASSDVDVIPKLVTIATQTSAEYLPVDGPPVYDSSDLAFFLPSSLHSSWSTPPDTDDYETLPCFSSDTDTASIVSFNTSTSASLDSHGRSHGHHFGTKVEMVYSLLSMLGTQDREEMSRTLLAMSRSPDMCLAMRQAGCLPLLVQLLHGACDRDSVLLDGSTVNKTVTARAAAALHNVVHCHPDDKQGRREARVLRLLEQIRAHCEMLQQLLLLRQEESGAAGCKDTDDQNRVLPATTMDHKPGPAIAALMKLSFDEEHRHAICMLGGIQAIGELLRLDDEVNGNTGVTYNLTMRRYACMALTNLTFGDGANKALLCSMASAMMALVSQLRSCSDDLRQVAASVLRNLSWRADLSSKKTLRDVGAVVTLMETAMDAKKESTLKSMLSALWNLSAHCSENKADICAVNGSLSFLVACLNYRSPSKTLAIIENAGGILRNVSSHIAVREDYRTMLREHGTLEILLKHLRSPSLTIVSNACGTLWNLSARCIEDQRSLWQLGAVSMLKNLVHSKHKMISMGSAAALKNLISARPQLGLENDNDALFKSSAPGLHVRKQRALEAELNNSLSETCDNLESPPSSPQEVNTQKASRTLPLARFLNNCHPLSASFTANVSHNTANVSHNTGNINNVNGNYCSANSYNMSNSYSASESSRSYHAIMDSSNIGIFGDVVNTSMVGLQQHLTGLTSLRPHSSDCSNYENWNVCAYDNNNSAMGSYSCSAAATKSAAISIANHRTSRDSGSPANHRTSWDSSSPSPSPPYQTSIGMKSFLKSTSENGSKQQSEVNNASRIIGSDTVRFLGTESIHLTLPDDFTDSCPSLSVTRCDDDDNSSKSLLGFVSASRSAAPELSPLSIHCPEPHFLPTIDEDRNREAEESEAEENKQNCHSSSSVGNGDGGQEYLTIHVEPCKSDNSDEDDYNDNDDDEDDEEDTLSGTISSAYEKQVKGRLCYVNSLKKLSCSDSDGKGTKDVVSNQMSPIIRDEDFDYDYDGQTADNLYERYSGLLVLDTDFSHLPPYDLSCQQKQNDGENEEDKSVIPSKNVVLEEAEGGVESDASMDSERMFAEAARLSEEFASAAIQDAENGNCFDEEPIAKQILNVTWTVDDGSMDETLPFVSGSANKSVNNVPENLNLNKLKKGQLALEELLSPEEEAAIEESAALIVAELSNSMHEDMETGLLEAETLSFVDDAMSEDNTESLPDIATDVNVDMQGEQKRGPRIVKGPQSKVTKTNDEVEGAKGVRGRRKALYTPKSNSASQAVKPVSSPAGRATSSSAKSTSAASNLKSGAQIAAAKTPGAGNNTSSASNSSKTIAGVKSQPPNKTNPVKTGNNKETVPKDGAARTGTAPGSSTRNTLDVTKNTSANKSVVNNRAKSAGADSRKTSRTSAPAASGSRIGSRLTSPSDAEASKVIGHEKGRSASVSSFRDVEGNKINSMLSKVASSPDTVLARATSKGVATNLTAKGVTTNSTANSTTKCVTTNSTTKGVTINSNESKRQDKEANSVTGERAKTTVSENVTDGGSSKLPSKSASASALKQPNKVSTLNSASNNLKQAKDVSSVSKSSESPLVSDRARKKPDMEHSGQKDNKKCETLKDVDLNADVKDRVKSPSGSVVKQGTFTRDSSTSSISYDISATAVDQAAPCSSVSTNSTSTPKVTHSSKLAKPNRSQTPVKQTQLAAGKTVDSSASDVMSASNINKPSLPSSTTSKITPTASPGSLSASANNKATPTAPPSSLLTSANNKATPTAPPRSSSLSKAAVTQSDVNKTPQMQRKEESKTNSNNKGIGNINGKDQRTNSDIIAHKAKQSSLESENVENLMPTMQTVSARANNRVTTAAVGRMMPGTAASLPAGMSSSLAYEQVVKSSTFEKLASCDVEECKSLTNSILSSDSSVWRRTYTVTDEEMDKIMSREPTDSEMLKNNEATITAVKNDSKNIKDDNGKEKKGEKKSFLSWFRKKKESTGTSKIPTVGGKEQAIDKKKETEDKKSDISSPTKIASPSKPASPSKISLNSLATYSNGVRLVSLSSDGEDDSTEATIDANCQDSDSADGYQQPRVALTKKEILLARRRQSCMNSLQSVASCASVTECSPSGLVTTV